MHFILDPSHGKIVVCNVYASLLFYNWVEYSSNFLGLPHLHSYRNECTHFNFIYNKYLDSIKHALIPLDKEASKQFRMINPNSMVIKRFELKLILYSKLLNN